MLDMGFFDDIMSIYSALPKDCQTLMFSATMPPKIKKLAKQILKNPVEVKIAVSKPADNIDQSVYFCNDAQKTNLLAHLFTETPPQRVIVFSSSKQKIKELTRELRRRKFNVGEMHSDLDQPTREQVMLDFKASRIGVLLATDIVARGIDIDDITLVVNYDVPRDAEDYVHRIGRTARAASSGAATTFVSPRDRQSFARIEQLIEMQVPRRDVPGHLGGNASEGSGRERRERNPKGRRGGSGRGGRGGKEPRREVQDNSRSDKPMEAAATGDKSARKPHNHGTHRGGRGRGRGNGGAKNDKPSDPQ